MEDEQPRIIFFTELDTAALAELLRIPWLLDALAEQQYGVAMGMLDFSDERAELVRQLIDRGVEVTAWLLLPHDAGYWFNVENYPQAIAQYHAFDEWARAERLAFVAVGLDMEPSLQYMPELQRLRSLPIISRIMAARSNALYPAAYEAYHDLAAEIRSNGYEVHTYQYPFVVDDRRMGTTLVQRTLNVVDLRADVEVLMCYSSMIPRRIFGGHLGGALIAAYGLYADSIGVGSTGGGIVIDAETGARAERLSWEAFARDLRLAALFTDMIHVFSLEGCVTAGYFEQLRDFDWHVPVSVPRRYRITMRAMRLAIETTLWWSRFGLTMLGWLGWVVVAIMMLKRAFDRQRSKQ
jgi:hypothetical protein